MSRVLVFGGNGFIGAHVREALGRHADVEAVVTPGRERLDLVTAPVEAVETLLRTVRPDAVVNCAGSMAGLADALFTANTVVTAKLVEAIGRAAPGTRFVRLGSAGEYGVVERGHAATEDDPAHPVSAYGLSHLSATQLTLMASAAGDVDGVVLRVFNPVGPGPHTGTLLGRGVAQLREALARGADHITMGPLSAWRDFVDVRDLADAVAFATLTPRLRHRVFNIASGVAVQSRTAVQMLAAAAGFTGVIREDGVAQARSAAVDWMRGDVSRAQAVMRWSPAHDLADSVKAIWAAASPAAAFVPETV